MKNLIRFAIPALAVVMMSGSALVAQTQNTQSSSAEWNTPPAGTEQAQQGFRDGIEAAQLDRAAKRKIDAKASHLYVHPPVKGVAREDYRSSFEAGYNAAVMHNTPSM